MYLYFVALVSSIPFIDKLISNGIRNIKKTWCISKFYSKYITDINAVVAFFNTIYYKNYKSLIIRIFVELIIINFCFKWLLDRPRPRKFNGKYISIFNIKLSKKWMDYQSFPSGHVASSYLLYFMFKGIINKNFSIILYFLTFVTAFARMNLGAHYFSDCVFAVLISERAYNLLYHITS